MKYIIITLFLLLFSCVSTDINPNKRNFSYMEADGMGVSLEMIDNNKFIFSIVNEKNEVEKISLKKVNYFTLFLRGSDGKILRNRKIEVKKRNSILYLKPNTPINYTFNLESKELEEGKRFTLLVKPNFLGKKYKNCVPSVVIEKKENK
ncbi:MAG: hypothetical protein CR982_09460 [Candidatus Cloacimonadota bacterium]|nr:MAG: hypothetical protein CR982_09460 [Candidatus Cloacimonadota bacterium]PIE79267.1 MAG: hypothetical protein CSA15_03635 [Candidatus Delongbacteria bacterium]